MHYFRRARFACALYFICCARSARAPLPRVDDYYYYGADY